MKDNIQRLIEIIGQPDRCTDDELDSLMGEPEISEIYELVCLTKRAIKSVDEPDVDSEWEKFRMKNSRPKRTYKGIYGFFRRNAAIILTLIIATIGAVAGSFAIKSSSNTVNTDNAAVKDVKSNTDKSQLMPTVVVEDDAKKDTMENEAVTFKNMSLSEILNDFSSHYGISKVIFKTEDTSSLKLYFRWDKRKSLEEVVNELNEFQQIDIRIDNNDLIIE